MWPRLRHRLRLRHRGERVRSEREQLFGGGIKARVPLYVAYADFFQYQAGPGRLADRA